MTMAKYETPPPVRPLEKLITDFSYTNGLDPVNVLKELHVSNTHLTLPTNSRV